MDISYESVSNSGERIVFGDRPGLIQEHVDRYAYASKFIPRDSRILDAACGSGYGSDLLAEKVRAASGMDISSVAVAYCRATFVKKNLQFFEGSVEAMPFHDKAFDWVISYETIEHIPNPAKMLSEVHRVLADNGTAIISTPNRVASGLAKGQTPHNPFHIQEWSALEFYELLEPHFSEITFYGQRIKSSNKMQPMYMRSKWKRVFGFLDFVPIPTDRTTLEYLEKPKAWQPLIIVAVCKK